MLNREKEKRRHMAYINVWGSLKMHTHTHLHSDLNSARYKMERNLRGYIDTSAMGYGGSVRPWLKKRVGKRLAYP